MSDFHNDSPIRGYAAPGSAAGQIVSGEGVTIALPYAGVGSRLVASVIDMVISMTLLVIVVLILGASIGDSAGFLALLIAAIVLAFGVYPTVWEWLTKGKTLGKMAMGVRVVRLDGGPIRFRHALVRGVISLVLEKGPLITIGGSIGLIVAMCNVRNRRIADLAAGTCVINERAGDPRTGQELPYFYVPPELVGWAMSLDLSRLSDQLALTVRQFVMRAAQMSDVARYSLGESLRAQVHAVVMPPPPMQITTSLYLTTILAERRRRAESAHR